MNCGVSAYVILGMHLHRKRCEVIDVSFSILLRYQEEEKRQDASVSGAGSADLNFLCFLVVKLPAHEAETGRRCRFCAFVRW